MEIKPYKPTDLDAVIAVYVGAIREVAVRDYNQAQIDVWAHADRAAWAVRRLNVSTWVAFTGQLLTGFTALESDGHLDVMYVHPAHQGEGIATALLAYVELVAHERDLSRVFTEASITARPFFERRGFRVVLPQFVELRGQTFRNFRMEKLLT